MSYFAINIEKQNPDTEVWGDFLYTHAIQVNKASGGESYNAGAGQYHPRLTFVLRYCRALEAIAYSPQTYRLIYRGHKFNIVDYDDYMEQHLTVKLVGEAYE